MAASLTSRTGVIGLTAAAGVALYFLVSSFSDDAAPGKPTLTAEECAKLFDMLTGQLNGHVQKLGATLQQIQQVSTRKE